ncbi:MAG TPA: flagellar hook basal-body protein, partial [Sedimentisphaerales bacterium]|nr:flagellar hook basal-body protein [Sedimentisphaerales bacterium]
DDVTNLRGPVAGVPLTRSGVDFTQGGLVPTGRSLDLAINGSGFFVVETPERPLYTRNGTFQVNGQGQIVDAQGRIIGGEGGAVVIPAEVAVSDLVVASDGTISAGGLTMGRLRIVEFENPKTDLVSAGMNCFAAVGASAPAMAQNATVRQGYQEGSNVNAMEELVGLITVSRLYESSMKVLTARSEASRSLMSVAMG